MILKNGKKESIKIKLINVFLCNNIVLYVNNSVTLPMDAKLQKTSYAMPTLFAAMLDLRVVGSAVNPAHKCLNYSKLKLRYCLIKS